MIQQFPPCLLILFILAWGSTKSCFKLAPFCSASGSACGPCPKQTQCVSICGARIIRHWYFGFLPKNSWPTPQKWVQQATATTTKKMPGCPLKKKTNICQTKEKIIRTNDRMGPKNTWTNEWPSNANYCKYQYYRITCITSNRLRLDLRLPVLNPSHLYQMQEHRQCGKAPINGHKVFLVGSPMIQQLSHADLIHLEGVKFPELCWNFNGQLQQLGTKGQKFHRVTGEVRKLDFPLSFAGKKYPTLTASLYIGVCEAFIKKISQIQMHTLYYYIIYIYIAISFLCIWYVYTYIYIHIHYIWYYTVGIYTYCKFLVI